MAFFFTDSDLSGAGETAEAEVWLATEFTLPAGLSIAKFRWRFPAVASGVTPKIRVYDSGNNLITSIGTAGVLDFDTSTNDAWNNATPAAPWTPSADTYRVVVNTTRYVFVSGFFTGGSVTRSGVTAVQSRFGSPGSAPTSTSTVLFTPDIDFSGTTQIALSDAGSSAEAAGIGVTLGLTEAGAGADTSAAPATVPLADAGSEAEALAPAVTAPLADAGAGADLLDNGQSTPIALADRARAVDILSVIRRGRATGRDTSGWDGFGAIMSANLEEIGRERAARPETCPVDGALLEEARGVLHCTFGGETYDFSGQPVYGFQI